MAVRGISRLGARPQSDDRQQGTHRAAKRWLAGGDAVDTRFAFLHSEYFRSVVPARDLIGRLVADRRPGEERELDFSPWGGAYNPYGTGGAYPNFPEPGLSDEAYYLGNTGRLRRIRAAYDPDAVFAPSTGAAATS